MMISHVRPEMRPTDGSANWLKAWGEKSRSPKAHPSQRSVSCTWIVLPWSVIGVEDQKDSGENAEFYAQVTLAVLPHSGLLFGLPPA